MVGSVVIKERGEREEGPELTSLAPEGGGSIFLHCKAVFSTETIAISDNLSHYISVLNDNAKGNIALVYYNAPALLMSTSNHKNEA